MVQLHLGYDTASILAADALFGGSGDQREHSEKKAAQQSISYYTLVVKLVNGGGGDAWCTGWVGKRHRALNWLRDTIEEESCLCAVDCAWFDLRSLIGDHQIENGQNRRAAIEFRHRFLRDLDVTAVRSENRFKERQEAWRAIEKSKPLSRERTVLMMQ